MVILGSPHFSLGGVHASSRRSSPAGTRTRA